MSCCPCNLFDLECLRERAGVPAYVTNDNHTLVYALHSTNEEMQKNLGACFDYLCELKTQIEQLLIAEPTWWQTLVNKKLLPYASKVFRKYFLQAGLVSGNNEGTVTADAQAQNYKLAISALFAQSNELWKEVEKWLNENAEANNISCWSPTCDTICSKKKPYLYIFAPETKKTIY